MTADSPPSDLGAILHQARESRSVSLGRIADATKISVSILQALERNDISRLPGGILGRGFVRSFATEVGLDPEGAVAQFVAQFPTDSVTVGYPTPQGRAENEVVDTRRSAPRTLSATRTLWVLAGCVVLPAALLTYLATGERTRNSAVVQRTSDAPMAEAAPSEPAIASVNSGTPVAVLAPAVTAAAPVGSTEDSAPPTATSATFAISPDSVPATGVPAAVPVTPVPESAPATPESTATTIKTDAKPATEEPTTQPIGRLFVVLAAIRPSWIIVKVDGRTEVNRLLEVGEQEMLTGRDLVLTAGDAGAIVMTVNGAAARPLGRAGQAVKTHVNRTNLKKYLAPR